MPLFEESEIANVHLNVDAKLFVALRHANVRREVDERFVAGRRFGLVGGLGVISGTRLG